MASSFFSNCAKGTLAAGVISFAGYESYKLFGATACAGVVTTLSILFCVEGFFGCRRSTDESAPLLSSPTPSPV